MDQGIRVYNDGLASGDEAICDLLAEVIAECLPEAVGKIWHRHPVWFLDGNPVVGYSRLRSGVRLLFWSGRSFDEPELQHEGTFQAAEVRFDSLADVDVDTLRRWLAKSRDVQWDYKNIVKLKGVLVRLDKSPE